MTGFGAARSRSALPRSGSQTVRSLVAALFVATATTAQHPAAAPEPKVLDVTTAGGPVRVRCEVLRATLHDEDGQPTASVCGFAYLGDDPSRPVTFFWNGGPGFCSSMLHTGFAAPRVANLAEFDGLVDNPQALVDVSDLVYVDPVGTGFSSALAPTSDDAFFGVHEDARAAAEFVADVVEERGWTGRRIVLCGESYGGIRVAAMLAPLRARGVVPSGLVLISPALDWLTLTPRDDDQVAIAAMDAVPTLAALAMLDATAGVADPRATIEAACRLATGPMLDAVRAGDDPHDPSDPLHAAELARLVGGRAIGKLVGVDLHDARLRHRPMRIGGVSLRACDQAIAAVLAENFGIGRADGYRRSIPWLSRDWRGEHGEPFATSTVEATRMLGAACRDGWRPRVFVAGGWYDVAVPFGIARRLAAEGAFGDCELELRDYPAGHMLYVDAVAHAALAADLRGWYAADRR